MGISEKDYYAMYGLEYDSQKMLQNYSNCMSIKTLENLKARLDEYSWEHVMDLGDVYSVIDDYIRDLRVTLSNAKEKGMTLTTLGG